MFCDEIANGLLAIHNMAGGRTGVEVMHFGTDA